MCVMSRSFGPRIAKGYQENSLEKSAGEGKGAVGFTKGWTKPLYFLVVFFVHQLLIVSNFRMRLHTKS